MHGGLEAITHRGQNSQTMMNDEMNNLPMRTPAYLILAIIISITSIMASININSAASPIILENPHKIGDQHVALSVIDRVTNQILHINILLILHCIDQLVGAMTSTLGSYFCILTSANEHPNSHGIKAESNGRGPRYHHVILSSIP